MFAYYLLVGAPLLLALLLYGMKRTYRLEKVPYQSKILGLFFLICFCLLAFRASNIGSDTSNYLSQFYVARNMSWRDYLREKSSEIGFTVLTKLISEISGSGQFYLAIIAFLSVYPLAKLYREESESPILTISLYLILPMFAMQFSGLRQAVAMAFVPLAYSYVKTKRWGRFLAVVLIATLFHKSAWLILLLYPTYHINISRKALLWAIPALFLVYMFNEQIYVGLIAIANNLYSDRYAETTETGAYSMLFLFAIILFFSYLFLGDTDVETKGQRNILFLSVAIQCFALVNRVAMRMNYYFLLFLPLLLPKVIRRIPYKNKWFASMVEIVCCAYFLYYFMDKMLSGQSAFGIYPYIPFWKG